MAEQWPNGQGDGQGQQQQHHRPQNVKEAYTQTTALHNKIFSDSNLSVARSQLNRCLAASPEYQQSSWGLIGTYLGADNHFRRETTRSIATHQVLAIRPLTDREVSGFIYIHERGTREYVRAELMINAGCAVGALSGAWPLPRAWLNGMMSPKIVNSMTARTLAWMIPVSVLLSPYKTWRERSEMVRAQNDKKEELQQLSDDVGARRDQVVAAAVQAAKNHQQQPSRPGQQPQHTQNQVESTADWGSASSSAQREEYPSSPQAQTTTYKSGWFGRGSSRSQPETSYDASPSNESWEPAAAPSNKNWENESSSSSWDAPIFDDGQSPIAASSRPQYSSSSSNPSGQTTSWAQVRAQAGQRSGNASQQAPTGDSSWGNAQGSSSGYNDGSWSAGTGDGQTSWEKQKAQKEFDAMIERERGLDQSPSGRILR